MPAAHARAGAALVLSAGEATGDSNPAFPLPAEGAWGERFARLPGGARGGGGRQPGRRRGAGAPARAGQLGERAAGWGGDGFPGTACGSQWSVAETACRPR